MDPNNNRKTEFGYKALRPTALLTTALSKLQGGESEEPVAVESSGDYFCRPIVKNCYSQLNKILKPRTASSRIVFARPSSGSSSIRCHGAYEQCAGGEGCERTSIAFVASARLTVTFFFAASLLLRPSSGPPLPSSHF